MSLSQLKRKFILVLRLYPVFIALTLFMGYLLGGFSQESNGILPQATFYTILSILAGAVPLVAMLTFLFISKATDREFFRNILNQENFNFQDAFALPDEKMHGYKLARIVGREPTFMGLTGDVYTADASAQCGVNPDHVPPVKGCQCGFHAFKDFKEAIFERSIYRTAFLFDVDLFGLGFIYRRGYRAETQVINHMIAPKRCMLCKTLPVKRFVAKYDFSSIEPGVWEWQIRCFVCSSATKPANRLSIQEMAQKLHIQII